MAAEPEANMYQQQSLSALETEKVNPATVAIDSMSPLEIVQVMNVEDAKVAEAVRLELPHIATAIEALATRMRRGGRLLYMDAGTSGRLGSLVPPNAPHLQPFSRRGSCSCGRWSNRISAG